MLATPALLVALLCAPPEVHVLPLPPETRNDSAAVAAAPDGTLWAAWSSLRDGRFRLAVAGFAAGRWSALETPDPAPGDQTGPRWFSPPGAEPGLVYAVCEEGEWRVRMLVRDAGRWGPPADLGPGLRPAAAWAGGRIWAAWEEGDGVQVAAGAPGAVKPVVRIHPEDGFRGCGRPDLAAGGDAVWLAWSAARPGHESVRLRRLDPPGAPELAADDGSGVNREPRLAVDGRGRAWLVWEALRPGSAPGPAYVLEQAYAVTKPAEILAVTDGTTWWRPPAPAGPAHGLLPAVRCAADGSVRLLSRRCEGHFPLCEALDAGGWTNFHGAWTEARSRKEPLTLAEDPGGRLWTAWIQQDRMVKRSTETPSWTTLDAPDALWVAALPALPEAGPPPLLPWERKPAAAAPAAEPPRYAVTYEGRSLPVWFGDLHQHTEFSRCGRRNGAPDQNQRHSRFVRGLDFLCLIDHAEHLNQHDWRTLELASLADDRPGRFAVFTGFEWTSEFDAGGNLFRGHYNAIFRRAGAGGRPLSASDPRWSTPLLLWEELRRSAGGPDNALTFGHHPARRGAWLSWNYYDSEMVPLLEIAQARGSYEHEGCFPGLNLANDLGRVPGHFARDGLARGMRLGFLAGGDHGGRALCAVFAPTLDRDALFAALRARRCYATSGERLLLDLRVEGRFMGGELALAGGKPRQVAITVKGTADLAQVELVRNGRILRSWSPPGREASLRHVDAEPLPARENHYYLRVLQEDGAQAWSSPVWVVDRDRPGRFRFQVGGDELRAAYPGVETDLAILMHNGEEGAVLGRVLLDVPEGWRVREGGGLPVECPPGEWRHAVFHVEAPPLAAPCLPPVTARFEREGGSPLASPLFVVASPARLTPEQKAQLIEARTEVPPELLGAWLERMRPVWQAPASPGR